MSFFGKNPNESNYTSGKKHFADVIKNSGPGELLIWLNEEEDFNTNSTLIVGESEEALFFKDGVIEQVFDSGKYSLSTNNYPFISRIRNILTGGISTFNCKVYFVRKAHSMEIMWGTDTPIQLRDPIQGLVTSIQARGSYKIMVDDSKKFLIKMVGNNIKFVTQDELKLFFRNEFLQYIKSAIAKYIKSSKEEIFGICSEQDTLAENISPSIQNSLNAYGIRLVKFIISGIDIPANDPNRQKLEEAYVQKRIMNLMGEDWAKQQSVEILRDLAKNPGSGGLAAAGAGVGVGLAAGGVFGEMARHALETPSSTNLEKNLHFPVVACQNCGANNPQNAKFCSNCGTSLAKKKVFCCECGAELDVSAKFCPSCGTKQ